MSCQEENQERKELPRDNFVIDLKKENKTTNYPILDSVDIELEKIIENILNKRYLNQTELLKRQELLFGDNIFEVLSGKNIGPKYFNMSYVSSSDNLTLYVGNSKKIELQGTGFNKRYALFQFITGKVFIDREKKLILHFMKFKAPPFDSLSLITIFILDEKFRSIGAIKQKKHGYDNDSIIYEYFDKTSCKNHEPIGYNVHLNLNISRFRRLKYNDILLIKQNFINKNFMVNYPIYHPKSSLHHDNYLWTDILNGRPFNNNQEK